MAVVGILALVLAVATLLLFVLQQRSERPRLRIQRSPWADPSRPWKFVAIRVLNLPLTPKLAWLFNRRSADGCEVHISFQRRGEQQPRVSMSGRWSGHPEPVRLELRGEPPTVVGIYDPTLVPSSYRFDVPATGAWQEVAVAVLRDGEVYAFSAESYAYPDWKRPDWRLEPGEWDVAVTAAAAHARENAKFRLRITDNDFDLTEGDKETPHAPASLSASSASPEARAMAGDLAEQALSSERQSAENLGARSSWLIGFAGVVLALVAGLNKDAVIGTGSQSVNLGKVGEPVSAGLALGAVVLLLLAAVVARLAVAPRKRGRLPSQLLENLMSGAVSVEHTRSEVARLKVRMYNEEAGSNDGRGTRLKWAFRLLVAGLLFVSAEAVILFLHRAKVW